MAAEVRRSIADVERRVCVPGLRERAVVVAELRRARPAAESRTALVPSDPRAPRPAPNAPVAN